FSTPSHSPNFSSKCVLLPSPLLSPCSQPSPLERASTPGSPRTASPTHVSATKVAAAPGPLAAQTGAAPVKEDFGDEGGGEG
ncbi:hypothetical protein DFH09DRAFT_1356740, partial [Mycena vulgaris]